MTNIVNYTDYNTFFTHPIQLFDYIKSLIHSQEKHPIIIYKIQNIIHNTDKGINGFKTSTTMAFT